MTMDERIEAAARAYDPAAFNSFYGDEGRLASRRVNARYHVKNMISAAFPELTGDKPTHWLAPMEATEEMCRAAGATPFAQEYKQLVEAEGERIVGAPVHAPVHDVLLPIVMWRPMRDAYLGKGDGG